MEPFRPEEGLQQPVPSESLIKYVLADNHLTHQHYILMCKMFQCLRHLLENNISEIFRFFHILWDLQKLSFEKEGTVVLAE